MASFINDGPTAWFCVEWAPTNRHKNHDIIYFDNRQEADTFIIAKSRNNKSIYMYEKGMYISRSGKEQKALVCIFWTSAAAIAKWANPLREIMATLLARVALYLAYTSMNHLRQYMKIMK